MAKVAGAQVSVAFAMQPHALAIALNGKSSAS